MSYGFFLAALAGIILLYQKTNKLKKLSFILWPAADAFKNNFTQTPATILLKINGSAGQVKPGITGMLKNMISNIGELFVTSERRTANI